MYGWQTTSDSSGVHDNPNMVPSIHVSLGFLCCLVTVLESMSRIQTDVPWKRLAAYLTLLVSSKTDLLKTGDANFPV